MAKKAEKKEDKAAREKAEAYSRKAGKKEEVAGHEKLHKKEEKQEKKSRHKEEKREKGHGGKPEEEKGHKEEARHGEKTHREEKHGKKGHMEDGHAKKEHAHNAKEETALDAPDEKEGHKGREKKRKPKRGKQHRMDFVELKPAEITEAIVHLANEGHSSSEIGMILRDQYGVPMVGKALGKKLCMVLRENKLLPPVPDDMMSLIRKSVTLGEHLARNRKDMSAKRGLMLTVSKIRALEKYYKKKGVLPMDWRYSPETAALLAK